MTMKTQQLKTYRMQQKQSQKEVYSNTILPQEIRKTLTRQPSFSSKATIKRRIKKSPKLVEGKKL